MTPRLLVTLVMPSLFVASLATGTPLSRMPDRSKAERLGYVIETEGGEEGRQSVFIPANKSGGASTRGVAPSPGQVAPRAAGAGGAGDSAPSPARRITETLKDDAGREIPFYMSRTERDEPNSALNRVSRKEENLSERRFDSKRNDLLDSRFDRKDAVGHEMWGRRFDSFGRKRNESVDMDARFDAPRVGKEAVVYDRVERRSFERGTERAEIANWDSRRSRDSAPGFERGDSRSSLQSRLAEGYSLLSRVSMQDINRYQFRRNHSTEKGELPVAKPGREAEVPGASGR